MAEQPIPACDQGVPGSDRATLETAEHFARRKTGRVPGALTMTAVVFENHSSEESRVQA